ncbi:glycosyltransferase [Polaribacter haliotis]|uniref:Glycosyltransferase n=1 Tax=Polaribacter haliotis TaxID=1888915 RepID=A0A7L8AHN4_9FLAO|nr:glycosyltransferase [Polaribacter haliotis]QOD61508.1 glycosyltransferase [Polaribacter haliotis]
MRVLQVIDKLNVGGAERIFVTLSNLLFQKNINVDVLIFINNGKLQQDLNNKINIIDFQRQSKFSFKNAKQLSLILKNYDIIHTHMRHVFRYVKVVSLVFNVKTKIILHDHSSNTKKIPFLLNSFLSPKYYIGVSNNLKEWAISTLNIQKKFCFLLHNVVVSIDNCDEVKKKEGAVVVGNIKPDKNQLFAIQLLPQLNTSLTIIGQIQDIDYFNSLIREIEKLSLQNKVTFIHNEFNVQKRLNNFQFALSTSIRESGPLVLIEFVAQSLPFIAFNTGEISLILNKDLPNFFINNFEQQKWIEKINNLKENNIDLKSIYDKNFAPNLYLQKCLNIYKEILNS